MKKILALAVLLTGLAGCYSDNSQELYPPDTGANCDTINTTYAAVIKPIIDSRCATPSCHNGPIPSGYDLSTYEGLQNVANTGKLRAAITWTGTNNMPKGEAKMDDCTINKILAWVNKGAQNN